MDESRDLIGDDEVADDAHERDVWQPGIVESVTAPEALGLASLVLAVLSLLGLGLLNGAPYVPEVYDEAGPDTGRAIVATLVGAGLALLPAALGARALRRLPDPSPARVVAGAGVLLAGLALVLRLAVAARLALSGDVHFAQF